MERALASQIRKEEQQSEALKDAWLQTLVRLTALRATMACKDAKFAADTSHDLGGMLACVPCSKRFSPGAAEAASVTVTPGDWNTKWGLWNPFVFVITEVGEWFFTGFTSL